MHYSRVLSSVANESPGREREASRTFGIYTFHYGRIDPATTTPPPSTKLSMSVYIHAHGWIGLMMMMTAIRSSIGERTGVYRKVVWERK
jgi:hypothetical protein